jgi:hypothetical protein
VSERCRSPPPDARDRGEVARSPPGCGPRFYACGIARAADPPVYGWAWTAGRPHWGAIANLLSGESGKLRPGGGWHLPWRSSRPGEDLTAVNRSGRRAGLSRSRTRRPDQAEAAVAPFPHVDGSWRMEDRPSGNEKHPACSSGGWLYRSPLRAGRLMMEWCTQAMRSKLEPMKQVAQMIRSHEALILNWFRARGTISDAAVEGLNKGRTGSGPKEQSRSPFTTTWGNYRSPTSPTNSADEATFLLDGPCASFQP